MVIYYIGISLIIEAGYFTVCSLMNFILFIQQIFMNHLLVFLL